LFGFILLATQKNFIPYLSEVIPMCDKKCKGCSQPKPQKVQHELAPNALKGIKVTVAAVVLVAIFFIDTTAGFWAGVGIGVYAMRNH
jgi:hypothetical protein